MASRNAYRDAPVSDTCPDIDNVIAMLEELRVANSKLREWGAELFDRVDELEKDLEEATTQVGDLQDEIECLKEELKEAQLASDHE